MKSNHICYLSSKIFVVYVIDINNRFKLFFSMYMTRAVARVDNLVLSNLSYLTASYHTLSYIKAAIAVMLLSIYLLIKEI